ncbi:23S rRNA (guanosine(2251)-2'-O)-methyltransferase RlmB [Roseomonas chloroacetimidivorans]|jgi:23S rRNA (guanosine2251-2'-O)-methyltransferase|uniref:23S rRNA (guanosine(2251)-2'-O)-methyltransferase RlmB n=1 Tax=Roseomonas chloroacetimidivorans TaxID=1766656 RepID=UPI003C743E52
MAPRQARFNAPPEQGGERARHAAPRRPEAPESASRGRTEAPRRESAEERTPANTLWLHGLHAVAAALLNPRRRLRRLLLTADAEAALTARLPPGTFAARKLQPERVEDRTRFHTFLPEDSIHQGAALLAEPLPGVALDDALKASEGPVLLLDQVTDPRNVGAILRSAAAFGAAAVVVQDRHAPPETGALARAASGALEIVPMVREVNLARAIRHLQDGGAWVMGLAGEAERTLAEAKPTDRRVGLVLGAEGGGLRRLQRETCDELVRLPISPAVESLNVAAAAAVALYEIGRA